MTRSVPNGYHVEYTHVRPPLYDHDNCYAPRGGKTFAYLYRDSDDALVAVGEARCSPLDNYNKRLGRTIALGRALAELDTKARLVRERKQNRGIWATLRQRVLARPLDIDLLSMGADD